jgi:hypothetical protein
MVACKADYFRRRAGVEIEPDADLLAIDTKMAFTVASLFLGIGKSSTQLAVYSGYTITLS